MKKILTLTCMILSAAILSACSTSSPIPGFIFTSGSVHHEDLAQSSKIGSGNIEKRGESCSYSILYMNYFFYGAGQSISEAAERAGITKIAVIDHWTLAFLPPAFVKDCVIVWGE